MDFFCAIEIILENKRNCPRRWEFWKKRTENPENYREALAFLRSAPSEEALPWIAIWAWAYGDLLNELLDPIFRLHASNLLIARWARVDEQIREWYDASNTAAMHFNSNALPHSTSLLVAAICHPSGRVREKALGYVSHLPSTIAAGLLILRVNDWVEPIRELAIRMGEKHLKMLTPEDKLVVAPILSVLRSRSRYRDRSLVDRWEAYLGKNLDQEAWAAAWRRGDNLERKAYLGILKQAESTPSQMLLETLLSSNDRGAILWCLREVLPKLHADLHAVFLNKLSDSKAVPVRREYLSYLAENQGSTATHELRKALLDRSKSLRRVAQYYITREGGTDLVAFYSESLKHPEREANALCGLAEIVPNTAHKEAVMRLSSPVPAVLNAAILALSTESLGHYMEFLVGAAQSNQPGVPRAARMRLEERIRELGANLVANPDRWKDFSPTFQKLMFHWSPRFQKWDGLEFLLDHLEDSDWRREAEGALKLWYHRETSIYVKLPPARKLHLMEKLDQLSPANAQMKQLRHLLEHAE